MRFGSFVVGFLVFMMFSYWIMWILSGVIEPGARRQDIDIQSHHKYVEGVIDDPVAYATWKRVMKQQKIISMKGISHFEGLSDKYLVELEGGYLTVAKLVQPDYYVDLAFSVTSFQDPLLPDLIYPHRSHRRYQGWTETAASTVAQLTFPQKKLPTIMRTVSSNIVWKSEGFGSWTSFFKYWTWPERDIYIALTPYISVVQEWSPPLSFRDYLIRPSKKSKSAEEFLDFRLLGDVSDLIVFDFLVDDHDRRRGRNWEIDENGNLLFWDSGLAFSHGASGKESCFNILCGPDRWRKIRNAEPRVSDDCKPICKFRTNTVERLRSMGPEVEDNKQLGSLVQSELAGQPVFEFGVYYIISGAYPKLQYPPSDFYASLNHRIAKFLAHVDSCVTEYGSNFVFDDFSKSL